MNSLPIAWPPPELEAGCLPALQDEVEPSPHGETMFFYKYRKIHGESFSTPTYIHATLQQKSLATHRDSLFPQRAFTWFLIHNGRCSSRCRHCRRAGYRLWSFRFGIHGSFMQLPLTFGPGVKGLVKEPFIFALACFASIGGLLFGYDQGVIAGVLVMNNFVSLTSTRRKILL